MGESEERAIDGKRRGESQWQRERKAANIGRRKRKMSIGGVSSSRLAWQWRSGRHRGSIAMKTAAQSVLENGGMAAKAYNGSVSIGMK